MTLTIQETPQRKKYSRKPRKYVPKRGKTASRRKKNAKTRKMTLKKADALFSAFIRQRDGKCVNCGRTPPAIQLQCSHFWGRGRKNTRYDPENCDALCAACHYWNADCWENEKQGKYREFKIAQLGMDRYLALEARARVLIKDSEAIERCLAQLKELEDLSTGIP